MMRDYPMENSESLHKFKNNLPKAVFYFVRPNILWFYHRDEGLIKSMSAEEKRAAVRLLLLENNPPDKPTAVGLSPALQGSRVGFVFSHFVLLNHITFFLTHDPSPPPRFSI